MLTPRCNKHHKGVRCGEGFGLGSQHGPRRRGPWFGDRHRLCRRQSAGDRRGGRHRARVRPGAGGRSAAASQSRSRALGGAGRYRGAAARHPGRGARRPDPRAGGRGGARAPARRAGRTWPTAVRRLPPTPSIGRSMRRRRRSTGKAACARSSTPASRSSTCWRRWLRAARRRCSAAPGSARPCSSWS